MQDDRIVWGEKLIVRALMKKNHPTQPRGFLLSCDLVKKQGISAFLQSQPPFHPMQHPGPPQGQAASGTRFSTALRGSRNHKDGPFTTVKDHEIFELFGGNWFA